MMLGQDLTKVLHKQSTSVDESAESIDSDSLLAKIIELVGPGAAISALHEAGRELADWSPPSTIRELVDCVEGLHEGNTLLQERFPDVAAGELYQRSLLCGANICRRAEAFGSIRYSITAAFDFDTEARQDEIALLQAELDTKKKLLEKANERARAAIQDMKDMKEEQDKLIAECYGKPDFQNATREDAVNKMIDLGSALANWNPPSITREVVDYVEGLHSGNVLLQPLDLQLLGGLDTSEVFLEEWLSPSAGWVQL
ncbi:uncharacterized protein Z520_05864 [Fonsecaea multimorphosa CBS 102226]|uniref:Uncharacterized protein n=1 Tax=Fonsecaea multimorphosa CBS 102226 TaxID=1442371 RepID=A0A0D2KPC9_9EURO|nr:uncharacterized protein Z520_05864 [Fonsecaea multimorphosa CBS 102226]KIX98563.1 hypothetical protein Z520_05864 [Fonsecaea multimorphosa CBS 102226]OAL24754.1 hypothetical protein AYO22_05543 [Fonsecaea multimorphosa]